MRRLARWLVAEFDVRTVVFIAGLGLLAAGAYQIYAPLGAIAPGAVLLFVAAPSRPPFVARPRPQKDVR